MKHRSATSVNRSFALFDTGEIHINDRPLLDIVREAEREFVIEERKQRIADGTPADEANSFESDYLYLRPTPSFRRNLFDSPERTAKNGFVIEPDDPRGDMATVLGCTCGIIECWFLLVSVTIERRSIIWSDFQQFHRDWQYNLRFVFDRDQYLAQLKLE